MSTAEVNRGKTAEEFKLRRRTEADYQGGDSPAMQQKRAMEEELRRALEKMNS